MAPLVYETEVFVSRVSDWLLFLQLQTFGQEHFRGPFFVYGERIAPSGDCVIEVGVIVLHVGLGWFRGHFFHWAIHCVGQPLGNFPGNNKKT